MLLLLLRLLLLMLPLLGSVVLAAAASACHAGQHICMCTPVCTAHASCHELHHMQFCCRYCTLASYIFSFVFPLLEAQHRIFHKLLIVPRGLCCFPLDLLQFDPEFLEPLLGVSVVVFLVVLSLSHDG